MLKQYLQCVLIQAAAVGICIFAYYIGIYCGIRARHSFAEDTLAFIFLSYIFWGAAGSYVYQYESSTSDGYFKYFKNLMLLYCYASIGFVSTYLIIIKTGDIKPFVDKPLMVTFAFLMIVILPILITFVNWLLNRYKHSI